MSFAFALYMSRKTSKRFAMRPALKCPIMTKNALRQRNCGYAWSVFRTRYEASGYQNVIYHLYSVRAQPVMPPHVSS